MKHQFTKLINMKKLLFLFLSIFLMACGSPIEKTSLNIGVEGMSCSHSCAPYIQKKLLKTVGVLDAEVTFENKEAKVVFDKNKITKEEIIKTIQTIADGQYKVINVEEEKQNDIESIESTGDESSTNKFHISNSEVSSSSYQLPNIFSLLNSLLKIN